MHAFLYQLPVRLYGQSKVKYNRASQLKFSLVYEDGKKGKFHVGNSGTPFYQFDTKLRGTCE